MLGILEIFSEHGLTDKSIIALFLDICRVLLMQKEVPLLEYFHSLRGMEIFTSKLSAYSL